MSLRPGFHPDAKREMREAADFYDLERPGLGSEFLDAVESTMQRVIDHPESAPIALDPVRKCKVVRFPYSVVYALRDGRVFVSAVAHTSRRPFYWQDRL